MNVVEFNRIDFKQHFSLGLNKDIFEGQTNLLEHNALEESYPLFENAIDKVISEFAYDTVMQHEVAQ